MTASITLAEQGDSSIGNRIFMICVRHLNTSFVFSCTFDAPIGATIIVGVS